MGDGKMDGWFSCSE
jgi:hypothetical protein